MTLLSILLFFVRCLLYFVYCPPYTQILAPPLVAPTLTPQPVQQQHTADGGTLISARQGGSSDRFLTVGSFLSG
jgi:hypothetical protein